MRGHGCGSESAIGYARGFNKTFLRDASCGRRDVRGAFLRAPPRGVMAEAAARQTRRAEERIVARRFWIELLL